MSAREIISQVENFNAGLGFTPLGDYQADRILAALSKAGYRILGPDELDPVTVVRRALEQREAWHKCSCPEPCDDYNVFPGGCAGRYAVDYAALLKLTGGGNG